MAELDIIKEVAEEILASDPDPVPRFRVLRDILRRPIDSAEIIQAKMNLSKTRWVKKLESEQWSDGSWGRFHTMDTKAKQKIATTEDGVNRALALGLDASHPILRKAAAYITCILNGTSKWRDSREVSWGQRWVDSGVQLISAATLAQIQPDLPVLDEVWDLWSAIVHRAFPSGKYNREQEIQAQLELQGIRIISKYAREKIKSGRALSTFSKYHIALLSSRADRLPRQLEKAYVTMIWNLDDGIGYLEVPMTISPSRLLSRQPSRFDAWLSSIELLTPFASWREVARASIDWLWEQRNEKGFWDFGHRSALSTYFPLSESWRKNRVRQSDWTVRVLTLLRKYHTVTKINRKTRAGVWD